MTASQHVTDFNKLNGSTVSVADLKRLKHRIDAQLAKEYNFDLEEISRRLERGISKAGADDVRVQLKSVAHVMYREEITSFYGVECIQDDKDLDGKPLEGISDTTYEVVTNKILELMKTDGLAWRKPWKASVNGQLAHNYVTKTTYSGTNFYLNWMGFSTPYYFTFKQVKELKGTVKAGAIGNPVVYFKWLYKDVKKNKLVDAKVALDKNGQLREGFEQIPALFYYTVFNHDQTEGLKVKPVEMKKVTVEEAIESCERIVDGMPKRPPIKHINQQRAFYTQGADTVTMPLISSFHGRPEYYSVLFHELAHSTGSPKRLARDMSFQRQFDKKYNFEELIAEMCACYLCAEAGILYHTMKNSAAYVKGFHASLMTTMKEDPQFFPKACAQAKKAADFILGEDHKAEKPAGKKPRKEFTPKSRGKKKPVKKVEPKPKPVKSRAPKKRKEVSTPGVKASVPAIEPVKIEGPGKSLGFITADQTPEKTTGTFKLPGAIGDLLGELQRYKLEIIIPGETHSSKSELAKQIADAFCSIGDDVAWLDWEQGGLQSKDTKGSIARNVKGENLKRFHVSADVPRTLHALKELSKQFKVIAIDSGTKIKEMTNEWIDELRESCPNTVWIIIMQQNAKGTARGGPAAEFDAPVVLKTYRLDESDYAKNYAYVFKNRGNKTGQYYNISSRKILAKDPAKPEPEATPAPIKPMVSL